MIRVSEPLPECGKCGKPTRRAVHSSTGGLCTSCSAWEHAAVVEGPRAADGAVEQLRDWQATVRRIRVRERIEAQQKAARRRLLAQQRRRRA